MTEGTVPVPPELPPDWGILMRYRFRWYRIFQVGRSSGGETPESVALVIEHVLGKSYYSDTMRGLLPTLSIRYDE
jgi:hypothetical protein